MKNLIKKLALTGSLLLGSCGEEQPQIQTKPKEVIEEVVQTKPVEILEGVVRSEGVGAQIISGSSEFQRLPYDLGMSGYKIELGEAGKYTGWTILPSLPWPQNEYDRTNQGHRISHIGRVEYLDQLINQNDRLTVALGEGTHIYEEQKKIVTRCDNFRTINGKRIDWRKR